MDKKEAVEMMAHAMLEEDAYIVLDIIKKAIELINLPPLMSDQEYIALTNEQRYQELMTRRICSFNVGDDVPCIFFRFVGDETPLANVVFFPIEAVQSFLDTARDYFNTPGTTVTPEEIEKYAFDEAVEMFCLMLRNIYPIITATMGSITNETINEWHRQQNERYRAHSGRSGMIIPSHEPVTKKIRDDIIKDYSNEVKNIWEREKKGFENFQKRRFAEEYEKLYEHWGTISLLYRIKKDFLGYAKRKGFEDTPDDLLEELKGSHHRGISRKALEHAARRVLLVNLNTEDPEIIEKRKNGIKASGFSDTTLYKYYDEGKKFPQYKRLHETDEITPQAKGQSAK